MVLGPSTVGFCRFPEFLSMHQLLEWLYFILRVMSDFVCLSDVSKHQQMVSLTRARRPSFSTAISNDRQLPVMADNLVYDMDSTTSPSSSDSDGGPVKIPQTPKGRRRADKFASNGELTSGVEPKLEQTKIPVSPTMMTLAEHHRKSKAIISPLMEKSVNQMADTYSNTRPRFNSSSEHVKSRRRPLPKSKDVMLQKRWV